MQETGEMIGLAFHVAAVAFLVLARKEFWAKVRRGALIKAAVALVAGMAIGILVGWGLLELFPARWNATTDWRMRRTGLSRSPAWVPTRSTASTRMSSSTPSSVCSARWR